MLFFCRSDRNCYYAGNIEIDYSFDRTILIILIIIITIKKNYIELKAKLNYEKQLQESNTGIIE